MISRSTNIYLTLRFQIRWRNASGSGYAAVLYCQTIINNKIQITLITACSHVVPLKNKIGGKPANPSAVDEDDQETAPTKPRINDELTIPKLELEGIKILTS